MPRKNHKHHYIYKITNLKNNKYYIGMHTTSDLEDEYFGSGDRIRNSIRYHGKENHIKEILEYLPDRISLAEREKEIVNEDLLKDPLCLNLKVGGEGGWNNTNNNGMQSELNRRSVEKQKWLFDNDPEWREKIINIRIENGSKVFKKLWEEGKITYHDWTGRKHNDKAKKLIGEKNSIHQKGEKNSQFGTKWINNKTVNKKIKSDDLDRFLKDGWIIGRI